MSRSNPFESFYRSNGGFGLFLPIFARSTPALAQEKVDRVEFFCGRINQAGSIVPTTSAQLYASRTGLNYARSNQLCLNKFGAWLTELGSKETVGWAMPTDHFRFSNLNIWSGQYLGN